MATPRVEVDLAKIKHNTQVLTKALGARGVSLTGVTKAAQCHPAIAWAMLDGGAVGIADARLSNIQRMRTAGVCSRITMIRGPMENQVAQIVESCSASYNSEIDIIANLSAAAIQMKKVHDIILMVEMGDMRDGILPRDVIATAKIVNDMPGVSLIGLGANFACLTKQAPHVKSLFALTRLAEAVENACGMPLAIVSGGNSASLPLFLNPKKTDALAERVTELRVGEAILLGVEPVSCAPIAGLFTDAFKLYADIIEAKVKLEATRLTRRLVLAIGHQDTDVTGLSGPRDIAILGATSDHLVVASYNLAHRPGSELSFRLNYSALARLMSAPDVSKIMLNEIPAPHRSLCFHL